MIILKWLLWFILFQVVSISIRKISDHPLFIGIAFMTECASWFMGVLFVIELVKLAWSIMAQ